VYLLGLYRFVIFVNRCRLECWDTLNGIGLDVDTGDVNCTTFELHGYTVHQIMLNTFYYQLTHTTLRNVELFKHSKVEKNAPKCFGLHGNHLQGAKVCTWLKVTRLVNSRCVKEVLGVVSAMAAYCDL